MRYLSCPLLTTIMRFSNAYGVVLFVKSTLALSFLKGIVVVRIPYKGHQVMKIHRNDGMYEMEPTRLLSL